MIQAFSFLCKLFPALLEYCTDCTDCKETQIDWKKENFRLIYGKHFTSNQKTSLQCIVFAKECKCDNDPMWTQCMCTDNVHRCGNGRTAAKSTLLAFNESCAQWLLLRSACGFGSFTTPAPHSVHTTPAPEEHRSSVSFTLLC